MSRTTDILETIKEMYPNAAPELDYSDNYTLLCAVMLSAQTTDKAVNKVTKVLWSKYDNVYAVANASITDLSETIKHLGLYRNKAKNLKLLSEKLIKDFSGEVPNTMEELVTLPGVGRKTANVVMSVGFKIPRIAVDTHVNRVSKRLKIAKEESSLLEVEQALMKKIPKKSWSDAHHYLLFFGRYHCLSRKPKCKNCLLKKYCRYGGKND